MSIKGNAEARENLVGSIGSISVIHGLTPYIKDGNWWIGALDTGVKAEGIDGRDGAKGDSGFSPIIEVTAITGGHRVTVTDANGTQTVDIPSTSARIVNIDLLANKWVGESSPYSQVVTVPTVTANTQVDLTPSAEQLAIFYNKDLAFVTENEDGVVTVYAIGSKPTQNYTMQATLTEVIV